MSITDTTTARYDILSIRGTGEFCVRRIDASGADAATPRLPLAKAEVALAAFLSGVVVRRFRERDTKCASCSSDARWMVGTTDEPNNATACDRHQFTWIRRMGGE